MTWFKILKIGKRGLHFAQFRESVLEVFEEASVITDMKQHVPIIIDTYESKLRETVQPQLIPGHINRMRRNPMAIITSAARVLNHNGWLSTRKGQWHTWVREDKEEPE